MGKKTLNRNKKENPPKRWDKIIGAVTLLTIVIFGFIIYNDYNGSSSKTASVNAEKNTVKQTESEKVTKAETDTKKNSNRTQVQGNPTVCIDAAHGGSSTGQCVQEVLSDIAPTNSCHLLLRLAWLHFKTLNLD